MTEITLTLDTYIFGQAEDTIEAFVERIQTITEEEAKKIDTTFEQQLYGDISDAFVRVEKTFPASGVSATFWIVGEYAEQIALKRAESFDPGVSFQAFAFACAYTAQAIFACECYPALDEKCRILSQPVTEVLGPIPGSRWNE